MKEQVIQVRDRALAACQEADSVRELEDVRVRFLGKKGELTQILRGMGQLSPEERPVMGKLVNEVREEVERALAERGGNSGGSGIDPTVVSGDLGFDLAR